MKAKRGNEKHAAFVRGLLKGIAGPVVMYTVGARPAPARVEIVKLHKSIRNPVEAMRSDWMQTGADLDAAIKKHSKTKSPRQAGCTAA
ncbi:hypothetical protein RA280_15220 [Cupriavidus sp. CV2]|uniref:hypothetical protein n=1 Tax=Cupriavidus ulmosensis TaxID=3065913 RepID=UPI00296B0D36|nr:hypothetical protein [Cupriavidus sp. CV2]MDW3683075.1 hypothetical protein [Cupriavidus sp. CV2]